MGKKVIVISLGGSLIAPNKINVEFLEQLKKVLLKNKKSVLPILEAILCQV